MNSATRQAIQASSAVLITLLLAYIFPLDHATWSTLTAVILVSSTRCEPWSAKHGVSRPR
ncbi:hypothetical protein Psal104b_01226 [Piscirickettsia salmonis]|uniref:hypothetical protein n=1 Tax=Piscirickettsia salmonis TaxID=1238 RepID=UPI001FF4A060|nr:hypothetical protein [Piscirickettsia salmonis]UOX24813.1 hypothetical protein Psal104b_01226 [Piscirickettsia salmonis]